MRRLRLLTALLGLVVLIALATWVAFALLRALPQRTLVMAVYPEGSVDAKLAKRYQEVLARSGIDLTLAPSAGAVQLERGKRRVLVSDAVCYMSSERASQCTEENSKARLSTAEKPQSRHVIGVSRQKA